MKTSKQPVILVAEDDSNDEHLLKWAFTNAGLDGPIHFVHDGAEAMDYLLGISPFNERSKYPFPQLLITDWKMPRVNGLELLAWLRQLPDLKQLPVVVMSGSSWQEDFECARALGVTHYLNKWLEFCELVQAIKLLRRELLSPTSLELANGSRKRSSLIHANGELASLQRSSQRIIPNGNAAPANKEARPYRDPFPFNSRNNQARA